MSRTGDRSGFVTAVLLVLLAGTALLVSTAGPWVTGVDRRPAPLPDELVERDAGDVAPAVRALGVVVLAGVPALLATRGRGRLVVGAVLLLVGAGAGLAAAGPALDPSGSVPQESTAQVVATVRPLLALAGAVATVLAGALVLAHGRRWAPLGRRYDAPAARRTAPDEGPERGAVGTAVDGAGAWDALDRGEDPTGR